MSKKDLAAQVLVKFGGASALNAFWGKERLTVLAYHRIIDWKTPDFSDYVPVVSANPAMFEEQMAFIDDHFNVISLWDLNNALTKNAPLPEHPLLITFDDGYLDNYQYAYPILKKFGFPAVIFLATSRMENPAPLWWDAVARSFYATRKQTADLPLVGQVDVTNPHTLNHVMSALKKVPEGDKLAAVDDIRQALEVSDTDQQPLFANWDQVRELVNNGIDCQAHTITHPIMTRISVEEQRHQLQESQQRIQDETGKEVIAFAYPNGTSDDYSLDTMKILRDLNYTMAFTLTAGPMRWEQVKAHPLQIRRVFLSYKDTIEMYISKVMGVSAFSEHLAYPEAKD